MLQHHDVENSLVGGSPARIEVDKYTSISIYILHFVFKGIVHPKMNSVFIYKFSLCISTSQQIKILQCGHPGLTTKVVTKRTKH